MFNTVTIFAMWFYVYSSNINVFVKLPIFYVAFAKVDELVCFANQMEIGTKLSEAVPF